MCIYSLCELLTKIVDSDPDENFTLLHREFILHKIKLIFHIIERVYQNVFFYKEWCNSCKM